MSDSSRSPYITLDDWAVSRENWVSQQSGGSSGPCNWMHCGEPRRVTSDFRSDGRLTLGSTKSRLHLHTVCHRTATQNVSTVEQISQYLRAHPESTNHLDTTNNPGSLTLCAAVIRKEEYSSLFPRDLQELPVVCVTCGDKRKPLKGRDYLRGNGSAGFHIECVGESDPGT